MFVLALNGIYETYTPRLRDAAPRVGPGQLAGRVGDDSHPPTAPLNPTLVAAQSAYGRTQGDSGRRPVLLAQDIMKSPVTAVTSDTPLAAAWDLMKTRTFRHIPVVSPDQRLIGIVSDRDLLRHANVLERHEKGPLPDAVGRIMTPKVLVATTTTEVREIAQVMLDERISAMPIINETSRPVGMLTVTDILRAVVNRAPLEMWS